MDKLNKPGYDFINPCVFVIAYAPPINDVSKFSTHTLPISIICLQMTLNPMITVQYQRLRPW